MKLRTSIAIVALAAACLLTSGVGSAAAQTPLVCQWGGTQPNPTGQITLDPGLTNTPSPSALAFKGWGTVTGGGPCHTTDSAPRSLSSAACRSALGKEA